MRSNVDLGYANNTHSVLARDKLDQKRHQLNRFGQSTSKDNIEPQHYQNLQSLVEIDPLLNFSLAETVSTLTQIIEFETNILENNYESKYLSSNREGRKLKILVIEDQDDSRNYICTMLRTENFQVFEAKDTRTAIRLAQANVPDLIICELMMPVSDGYGVVDSLCHSTITGNMLLLFITAHHQRTRIGSEIFLVSDREQIEPLTKKRLLEAINRRVNTMTVKQ